MVMPNQEAVYFLVSIKHIASLSPEQPERVLHPFAAIAPHLLQRVLPQPPLMGGFLASGS